MRQAINKHRWWWIALICAIAVISIFIRFYHLGAIKDKIFDEVYFPVDAEYYLTGTSFFDAHPPLGKLIIAVSISIFGNHPFGWRAFDALAGLVTLAIAYGFGYDLAGADSPDRSRRRRVATIALFLFAIEPLILVESRVGLINIYLLLFSLASSWFFWRWYTQKHHPWIDLAIASAAIGAASAIKWIGLGAPGAIILFLLVEWWRLKKWPIKVPRWQWSLILLAPLIYLATFIPDMLRGQNLFWWHSNAFWYHMTLKATHPYGSAWWSWPIVLRPIWLYYQNPTPGTVVGIIEIGNVATWLAGLAAIVYTVITLKRRPSAVISRNLYLLIGYAAVYLPWATIERVKFIYHYLVPMSLMFFILALVLDEVGWTMKQKWLVGLILGLGLAFFLYFLPLLTGYPISVGYYQQHMWLRSWI